MALDGLGGRAGGSRERADGRPAGAPAEVLFESDGSTFALYPRPSPPKTDHTALYWDVPDIRAGH